MSSQPLVSIILPSYNHKRFVDESIQSVISQSYDNIQLIVIDDGSTDGSVEMIDKLAKRHGFYFEAQKNMGLIATLNRARELIQGKYVSFTASDDYFHPKKIERLVGFLENKPEYAMVHANIIQVDEYSREISLVNDPCHSGWVFNELMLGEFHINGLSALVRTDVYREFHYGRFYIDDLYMWLSISRRYPVGYLNECVAYYRRHENHMSGNIEKMRLSEKEILDQFWEASCYPEAVMRWREKWFRHHAGHSDIAIRAAATRMGLNLLRDRRWSISVIKGWIRLVITSLGAVHLSR